MKSAIGIGSLLADGLGDTVRVSLTEDPEYELVPCSALVDLGAQLLQDESKFAKIPKWTETFRNFASFEKRRGVLPAQMEGDQFDIRGLMHRDGSVFSVVTPADIANPDKLYRSLGSKMVVGLPFKDISTSDSLLLTEVPSTSDVTARKTLKRLQDVAVGVIAPIEQLAANPLPNSVALVSLDAIQSGLPNLPAGSIRYIIKVSGTEPASFYNVFATMGAKVAGILIAVPSDTSRVHASRRVFQLLSEQKSELPAIHYLALDPKDKDDLILRAGSEAGALLVDGLGDGIAISAPSFDLDMIRKTSFNLLQGSRMRSVKTDFVSCPSCGRTLFDLQEVTEQIKQKTGHLPGVAIAIMGCIVNGPGEMADADFGYVGGAPGKVDLYVGKEVVKRGIPNAAACDALVELIKENGRWKEPPVKEEVANELASA
jgi:(E)-4-hydroxy-3-methylbut-2-enyl-diphosphate synthase